MKARTKTTLAVMLAFLLGVATAIPLSDVGRDNKPKNSEWSVEDSKAYALDQLLDWHYKEYRCLVQLWGKESGWRPEAYNKTKVMGKNAGGIPQLLGLDPKTPATIQIDRGLAYIYHRYGTPCKAWAFFQKKGYH